MKKAILRISAVLLATFFLLSAIQILGASAATVTSPAPAIGQKIALTNDQIKATWPNLPSAKQIYDNDVTLVIDLRYSGKQAASMTDILPDPKSPTVFDITSAITNYTTTTVNYHTGALNINTPQIWEQYNSTVWVKVPSKYLQTAMTPNGAQAQEIPPTWAVGMYANPQQVTGSADVWGVCTFGQWNAATFGTSGNYLGTAVLTVSSNNIGYQEIMQLDPNGRAIVWNWWSLSSSAYDTGIFGYVNNAITGQLYNMYIKYVTGSGWQFWWNQIYMGAITGDSSTLVRTGNQANVVVESNDFTSSHFSGFSTSIGGTYNPGNVPLCSAVYLYNGNWKPSVSGDSAPAGYTYLGGTFVNGVAIGTQAPPSNWGSLNIGQTSSQRERFTIGAGLTQRTQGYQLWASGTV